MQTDHGETLGLAIRSEIDARGVSAYELAKSAGVSESIVQRFVNGTRPDLKLSTASRIIGALGGRLAFTAPRRSAPPKAARRGDFTTEITEITEES